MYGPRSACVQERITQIRVLTPRELQVLEEIREASRTTSRPGTPSRYSVAWADARRLVHDAERGDFLLAARAAAARAAWVPPVVDSRDSANNAVADMVMATLVEDLLEPECFELLVAAFMLVVNWPSWLDEPGSRNLFYEMLAQGVTAADAQASVAALL